MSLSLEEIHKLLATTENHPRLYELSTRDSIAVLDEVSRLLDLNLLPLNAQDVERKHLQRMCVKLAKDHKRLPSNFTLKGVRWDQTQSKGSGGFAVVYSGRYNGEKVALKVLRVKDSELSAEEKEAKKWEFQRESLLWKSLSHVHVLALRGITTDAMIDSQLCMVMPWMENGSLRDFMKNIRAKKLLTGQNLVNRVDNWLYQTVQGLAYLHSEGIVHGDLHGDNLLLDSNLRIRITDFGFAVLADANAYQYGSDNAHGGGAVRFAAPELHGADEIPRSRLGLRPTRESDVFSFSHTVIEIYSGRLPYHQYDVHEVPAVIVKGVRPQRPSLQDASSMSQGLWDLMQECWNQDPEFRPPTKTVAETMRKVCNVKDIVETSKRTGGAARRVRK